MQKYTYRTTDHNDQPITGTYTIWPNGDNREIEYTYPDGDPARWTTVHVAKRHADGTPIFWKGHATLRPQRYPTQPTKTPGTPHTNLYNITRVWLDHWTGAAKKDSRNI